MARVYMMIGIPGAGKSHTVRELLEEKKADIAICPDDIREELYGDAAVQGDGNLVFSIAYSRAEDALEAGSNVIFDATNVSRKYRKLSMKRFPKGTSFIAVFVNTPFAECKRRNENRERKVPDFVLERMQKNLQEPSLDEGFDEIIVIE